MLAVPPEAVRVLLLEDSSIDAELIEHEIRRLSRPIVLSRAEVRAEYLAELDRGPWDLILSDYSLPDFDGVAALDLARRCHPQVPFVFVSGVLGEHFATEALRAGATDYVTKRDLARIPMVVDRALREAAERQERQRAVQALRESEERFRSMADCAPALIWFVDATGRLTFANARFEAEFGRPLARILAEGWPSLIHHADRATFRTGLERAVGDGAPFRLEVRIARDDGAERWMRCEGIPRHDDAGTFLGYTGCAVDITEARRAREALEAEIAERTEELRVKEEALRQSHKMEAIGQLTGGIAHDFNNMLAGIIGGADLIVKRLRAGRLQDCERYIEAVQASAHRAAALTHRLLAFSRRQTLDVRGTDVNRLVAGLEDLLHRTLGEAVGLETALAPDLWFASTDANQFESALINLAINARDAMPEGGRLRIESRNRLIDRLEAQREPGIEPGDYVEVAVVDTGVGMEPDVLAKAFDPFFTTKPIGQGTGLGLSMIYGFAKQAGGHVRIRSVVGEGTTVSLLMPRALELAEEPLAPELDLASGPSRRETILVVEDEPVVQMLIVDTLSELGYTTLRAKDANSALPVLESDQKLDLLLTDVGLPGMNGRQLAEIARRLRPDLRILLATGYADGAVRRADYLGDGMDLVAKPFNVETLGAKVRAMIAPR